MVKLGQPFDIVRHRDLYAALVEPKINCTSLDFLYLLRFLDVPPTRDRRGKSAH